MKSEVKEPDFKVGDMVSAEIWDDSVSWEFKEGARDLDFTLVGSPALVVGVSRCRECDSGFLYSVVGPLNRHNLDENWLLPWEGGSK